MSSTSVQFYFSPGSRYSYLAASQVRLLEAECRCEVEWLPVHGPAIRRLRGRDPFEGEPQSGQYDWGYRRRDAQDWAEYYGIPFREPPDHTFDFRLLVRASTVARQLGAGAVYGWRLACRVWASDTWPIDEEVCIEVAEEVGLGRPRFLALLSDPATERSLDAEARNAYERGVFGVPTFFVGERMFWGNDRIVLVRHALTAT